MPDADTLLLSLFTRQAHELRAHLRFYGVTASNRELAERVVEDAARHISRVRRGRDGLRSRLERLLTAY